MKTHSRDQGRTAGVGSVKRPSPGFVAMVEFDLLDMAVLRCFGSPMHISLEGREHGRTIPLAVLV
jgi:hypothetical protein